MLVLTVLTILLMVTKTNSFSPDFRGESRIFLDTADTAEWDDLLPTGIFHGVTTNPTLLERVNWVQCNKCTTALPKPNVKHWCMF